MIMSLRVTFCAANAIRKSSPFLNCSKPSFLRLRSREFHRFCWSHHVNSGQLNKNNVQLHRDNYLSATPCRNFSTTEISNIWFFGGSNETPAIPPTGVGETLVPPSDTLTATPVGETVIPTLEVTAAVDNPVIASVSSTDITEIITSTLVDPPFIEMGLMSSWWWPKNWIQSLLEWVHLNTDLPWWETIAIGTVVIRIISLYPYILSRRYIIRQNNHSDEMQTLMNKATQAKNEDNFMKQAFARRDLTEFYKRTGLDPVKAMLTAMIMPAIFMTSITAVRQMCSVPVPSLETGGALWFPSLVAGDPYYILPVLTGATITAVISVGMREGTMNLKFKKYVEVLKYLPIILMPIVFGNVATGIYIYWFGTSIITLGIQSLMQQPKIRSFVNIPELVKKSGEKKKSSWKEVWKDMSTTSTEAANIKHERSLVKRKRKENVKARKKELGGSPPITYEIGTEAQPTKQEIPDFEREWRPPKPNVFSMKKNRS